LIRPVLEAEEEGVKNCDDLMRLLSRAFRPNPEVQKFVLSSNSRSRASIDSRFSA